MYNLSPEIKTIWALNILKKTIFYTIFIFMMEYLLIQAYLTNWFLPDFMLTGFVFFLGIFLVFVYPNLAYSYWKFEIREEELYLERGVITRISTIAPFKRIQHLDVVQSLFDRIFGLSKLVVYTAGSKGADLIIPGLPIEYAEHLRDKLKNITNEDAV